jgi:hypothetical protein
MSLVKVSLTSLLKVIRTHTHLGQLICDKEGSDEDLSWILTTREPESRYDICGLYCIQIRSYCNAECIFHHLWTDVIMSGKAGLNVFFLMKQNFICISEIEMFEAWHPFIHSERLDLITIGNEPFSISIPCFSCFIEYQSYFNQVPTYQWLWVPILIVTILEIWDP